MYDDSDIDAAVAARTLTPATALAIRRFVSERRTAPPVHDAHFRYFAGAPDILATLGIGVLFAGAYLATSPLIGTPFASAFTAALAWVVAQFFAARRLGLPTAALFSFFAAGWTFAAVAVITGSWFPSFRELTPIGNVLLTAATASGCWLFWRWYKLPIAAASAIVVASLSLDNVLRAAIATPPDWLFGPELIVTGVATLAIAMWWDMTDVYRQTIRSDVAFWLHGMAGLWLSTGGFGMLFARRANSSSWVLELTPMVAPSPAIALAALILFGIFASLSLAIDRRALLIFSVMNLFIALTTLLPTNGQWLGLIATGAICLGITLTWRTLRSRVLRWLPSTLQAQLPRSDPTFLWERPVA